MVLNCGFAKLNSVSTFAFRTHFIGDPEVPRRYLGIVAYILQSTVRDKQIFDFVFVSIRRHNCTNTIDELSIGSILFDTKILFDTQYSLLTFLINLNNLNCYIKSAEASGPTS